MWNVESIDASGFFRNCTHRQYLTFTPGKDYVTYNRLTLTDKADENYSRWIIGTTNGYLNFHIMDDGVSYFINVPTTKMVNTYHSSGTSSNQCFNLIDETGKTYSLPQTTCFSSYIDSLKFDGRLLSYEEDSCRFIFPLTSSQINKGSYILRLHSFKLTMQAILYCFRQFKGLDIAIVQRFGRR